MLKQNNKWHLYSDTLSYTTEMFTTTSPFLALIVSLPCRIWVEAAYFGEHVVTTFCPSERDRASTLLHPACYERLYKSTMASGHNSSTDTEHVKVLWKTRIGQKWMCLIKSVLWQPALHVYYLCSEGFGNSCGPYFIPACLLAGLIWPGSPCCRDGFPLPANSARDSGKWSLTRKNEELILFLKVTPDLANSTDENQSCMEEQLSINVCDVHFPPSCLLPTRRWPHVRCIENNMTPIYLHVRSFHVFIRLL